MMIIERIFFVFIIFLLVVPYGFGKEKKLHKGNAILIEAYTQRILPGRREGRVMEETHFIINWQNKTYPQSFFWLNGDDTMQCNIIKTHSVQAGIMRQMSGRSDYYGENILLNKIQKGDTLDIRPITAGAEIPTVSQPKNQKNTLLYSVANTKTLYEIRVDSISKKRDIAMP